MFHLAYITNLNILNIRWKINPDFITLRDLYPILYSVIDCEECQDQIAYSVSLTFFPNLQKVAETIPFHFLIIGEMKNGILLKVLR
jgi:hypothetical protein